jgi:hypothetical protein
LHIIVRKGNILSFVIRICNTHMHARAGSSSVVLLNMFYVLFSYACIFIGQGFICRYRFKAMHSFVPPLRETKFCGVPPCVFDKLGCAVGERSLRNTGLGHE